MGEGTPFNTCSLSRGLLSISATSSSLVEQAGGEQFRNGCTRLHLDDENTHVERLIVFSGNPLIDPQNMIFLDP